MTRKIEQQMIAAIRAGKAWRGGNTMVTLGVEGDALTGRVHLHGHHIATVTPSAVGISFAGWVTNTTRSRLAALLAEFAPGYAVARKGGVPILREPGGAQRALPDNVMVNVLRTAAQDRAA